MNKTIEWNIDKNKELKLTRNISFEVILSLLETDSLLADVPHPNLDKYSNQNIFIVLIDNYIWVVPYVENTDKIFLKTIIPSRKLTKKYLGK